MAKDTSKDKKQKAKKGKATVEEKPEISPLQAGSRVRVGLKLDRLVMTKSHQLIEVGV